MPSVDKNNELMGIAAGQHIRLKRLSQNTSPACAKFNLKALQDKTVSQQFEVQIRNRFSVLDEDDLDNWETLRDVKYCTKSLHKLE